MHLAIDIGNTSIKAGLFKGDELFKYIRFSDWNDNQWKSLLKEFTISAVIISSVRGAEFVEDLDLSMITTRVDFDHHTLFPIKNKYSSPETLGKDRLAAAIGGWIQTENKPVLVVDLGTCIKLDFINSDNEYIGGNITPGLQMRLDAMHYFTAKLPQLELEEVADFIGTDTNTSLMTGAVIGVCGEINYFTHLYEKRFGKLSVILTGGNAEFLSLQLQNKYPYDKDLVLKGLNAILNYNINYEF